jgi:hypothetical protein
MDQEESRCATWKTDDRDAETDLGAVAVVVVLGVVSFAVVEVLVEAEAEPENAAGMDTISCLAATFSVAG